METCYGVKVHAKKKMKDGDHEWLIPHFVYYGGLNHGKMQTTSNHYAATAMTQNLAEQVAAKLNKSGLKATVCDFFADPDTLIHDTFVDIAEEARPPV